MNRVKATLAGFAFLVVIVLLCAAATVAERSMAANAAVKEAEATTPAYGEQGLPYGQALSSEILDQDEEYLYFSDRVLQRFHYDREAVEITRAALQAAVDSVPDGVNTYVMLTPLRIVTEPAYAGYTDDVAVAIDEIYGMLEGGAVTLDATGALISHGDEYVFFRTDDSWTALGAYYAAEVFAQAAGIELMGLDGYMVDRIRPYIGSLGTLEKAQIDMDERDSVFYYIHPDKKNWETVVKRRGKDDYATMEVPAVARSRRGTDIFIGGTYSHAVLQGDASNDRTLLIVGDSSAKFFAPWMTPYYENVYVINTAWYQGGAEGYQALWSEYAITDCIFLESADSFGDTVENQRLKKLGGGE